MRSIALARAAAVAMAVTIAASGAANAQSRDQIRIVGSSTVYPFAAAVAENLARTTGFRAPIVESTGTGGGMRLFCGGVGPQHPDVTNASRPITKSEIENCRNNGVTEIVEVPVGYDGIVITLKRGSQKVDLTREQIWKALARNVPVNGRLVPNPYKTWNEVDPKLPNWPIEVMGPPPTSGTRDAFNELVMETGCHNVPEIKAISDSRQRVSACTQVREDGRYIEAGENDNLIIQRLATGQAGLMGVHGYSFLEENLDKIEVANVEGVEPTFEDISSGKYPVARTIFFYAKKAHIGIIPGMREYMTEFVSDRAMGESGYLEQRGLIPLPPEKLGEVRETVRSLKTIAQ